MSRGERHDFSHRTSRGHSGFAFAVLLIMCATALGCFGEVGVVRVRDGRPQVGRFVSAAAYERSLEAALAEAKGDWRTAVVQLRAALTEDGTSAELTARLAYALCADAHDAEAAATFEHAIALDPTYARTYALRARCRLRSGNAPSLREASARLARQDVARARLLDPDSLELALVAIDVERALGDLPHARALADEACVLHPESAVLWAELAEVAAAQGDASVASRAALQALARDEHLGLAVVARAREAVIAAGLPAWLPKLSRNPRDVASTAVTDTVESPVAFAPLDARCATLFGTLARAARVVAADELSIFADGVAATCPEVDASARQLALQARWSPVSAREVEAEAVDTTSPALVRWAGRMRLRLAPTEKLLDAETLPAVVDRDTFALSLAAEAARTSSSAPARASSLAAMANALAPSEPTVARLAAFAIARTGHGDAKAASVHACSLARTAEERLWCGPL